MTEQVSIHAQKVQSSMTGCFSAQTPACIYSAIITYWTFCESQDCVLVLTQQLIRHNCHPLYLVASGKVKPANGCLTLQVIRLEIDTELQKLRGCHLPPPPASRSLSLVLGKSHTYSREVAITPNTWSTPLGDCFQKVFISCPGKWVFLLGNYT